MGSGALQKLRFLAILGPRDHQNRTRHVLKPPGKDSQGLGNHLGSIYKAQGGAKSTNKIRGS